MTLEEWSHWVTPAYVWGGWAQRLKSGTNTPNTMWTICWTGGEEKDGWDRFETREDVINFANTLVREGNVYEADILIFSPEEMLYDEIELALEDIGF